MEHFHHIIGHAVVSRQQLEMGQMKALKNGVIVANYKELQQIASRLSEAKHVFYFRCAKITYHKKVDRNSSLFNTLVKRNNRHNEIVVLENANCSLATSFSDAV